MGNSIRLPQLAWFGTGRQGLDIDFPQGWKLEICNMAGYDRPALTAGEIRHAVRNPLGMKPVRETAKGKKEVVIIFDDMSRVTRVAEIVPHILAELGEAGIEDKHIRFISALGNHGAMNRIDFVKKLGESVVSRFPVYNHNAFGNCTLVGTTSYGTPLYINSEVMKCDFKIGIGMIVPHRLAGFGGGAKIILPGVASFETSSTLHQMRASGKTDQPQGFTATMGSIRNNQVRKKAEEAAVLVGLDMVVDALVNSWGETVAIYAGSPQSAFNAGLTEAESHYLTPLALDCDIVIINTFTKVNESECGLNTALPSLKEQGGDIVLICNAPEGHVTHYLFGSWGTISGNATRLVLKLPPRVNHLIAFNEYPDLTLKEYFDPQDKVILLNKWEDVIQHLQSFHGDQAKVAVYPASEIQYFKTA